MDKFGSRAAALIRERCDKNRTLLKEELGNVKVSYNTFNNWERDISTPNARYLRNMALAGYDVIWILTGRKSHER